MIRKYYTRGDIILVITFLLASIISIAAIRYVSGGGKHVIVEVDGRHVLELSLDTDVTTTVTGPLGDTKIRVEGGAVRILDSSCPHKYCAGMGFIRHRGEVIICVPNHVIVSIRGGNEGESFDGVTQ
ncbi:MAG: NusG domain II-containing protein [Candidatus Latescibacteria bacterium]|nr:NusG domain II-containing protein [Candidatus Latescibacterota bacterium]